MVSMHAHHFSHSLSIWGIVLGVGVVPPVLLGLLFFLVKDVLIH